MFSISLASASRALFCSRLVGSRALSTSAAPKVKLLIDGQFIDSKTDKWVPCVDPATQTVTSMVPDCLDEEIDAAVAAAKAAFPSWSAVPVTQRARIMFKFQQLIRDNMDDLGASVSLELGKTTPDAKGDVFRGLEVVEQACGISATMLGDSLNQVSSDMDVQMIRQPLGVCAGICPFNFPAMIPLWMFPVAVTCGNTFVMKPSELVPGCSMMLAEMAKEAGLPDGVLNIIHGTRGPVTRICTHPDIRAISFVGGNDAGHYIHTTGTAHGKRVQANLAAKNHGVILPDAQKDYTIKQLAGAAFGAAGQRCMALSTAVLVGDAQGWVNELAEEASKLQIGSGNADFGPVVHKASYERILRLIQSAEEQGATILLDGRNVEHPAGCEGGNWLGPTIVTNVTTDMDIYKEEVFGPVLICMNEDSLQDAINLVNSSLYGNGTAVFTQSGSAARKYQHEIQVGLVGVNVPLPVPLAMFSFTGAKASMVGGPHFYGKQGVEFYTQCKTITSLWRDTYDTTGSATVMPTPK